MIRWLKRLTHGCRPPDGRDEFWICPTCGSQWMFTLTWQPYDTHSDRHDDGYYAPGWQKLSDEPRYHHGIRCPARNCIHDLGR